MEATAFAADLRSADTGLIIDLRGDINGGADTVFNAITQQALDQKPHALLLNFNGVGYINSTGIALIVGLLAAARKNGIPLRTYGLSDHYQEIFTITRLSDFMTIVANEAAALGSS